MKEASRTQSRQSQGLHVCTACGSTLVQPTRWEQTGRRGMWRLWRRCPECEWRGEGIHGEGEIDAYDEALDDGAEALTCELEELEREHMRELADALATALEADLIDAEDFRPRPGRAGAAQL